MLDEIKFEDLDYAPYIMDIPSTSLQFMENVRYASADFNKLYVRRLRLPDGKANKIYFLSKEFTNDIDIIKNNIFIIPPVYRKIFFNQWYAGYFMGRVFKFNLSKRKEYDNYIKANTKLKPYSTKYLQRSKDNILISMSDIYKSIIPILKKMNTKRCYNEFFKEFSVIINNITPDIRDDKDNGNFNNKILIINAESFAFDQSAKLVENKTNPLYLLYLAYLRNRDLTSLGVDIDMIIFSKNMFLKFNPSKMTSSNWSKFRTALFKICKANLDDYTDKLTEEEHLEISDTAKDRIVSNIISNATEPYMKNVSNTTKIVVNQIIEDKIKKEAAKKLKEDQEIKKAVPDIKIDKNKEMFVNSIINRNVTKNPLDKKHESLFKTLSNYSSLTTNTGSYIDEDDEEAIKVDSVDLLTNDKDVAEEVLNEVQDKIIDIKDKNAPVNSARDRKLREEQKKVVVKKETVEEILERDSSNVKIEEDNKSKVMHTTNKNMHKIKFSNFDKTYLDKLFIQDLVSCFDMLKDQNTPFYITNIDIRDTSTNLDYKETWTVKLKDELNKNHTITIDIPKFIDNRFMLLNGTKFMILKQNFYNPLVKDTPNTIILTTNYNKITIQRRSTKSLANIEKIFSLIKKTKDEEMFTSGDSSSGNLKYISSLEYDEFSRRLFKFHSENCLLFFSRDFIKNNLPKEIPNNLSNDEFYIGQEGKNKIIINTETGLDRLGRTITDIIEMNLPQKYKTIYDGIKSPNQLMFVEGKMAGQFLPIVVVLIMWNGLSKTLDMMKIQWKFDDKIKRIPKDISNKKFIRFANGILVYEKKTFAELILNGIMKLKPENFTFEEFNTEVCYTDFIYSQWGNYNGINEIMNFYHFLIDPITKKVCKDMLLPDDPSGLLIRSVQLLSDNAYVSKANDNSYRVRSIEIIPGILYTALANQYKAYVKSGRKIPFTLNRRAVISKLLQEKTVEPYSTINPVVEMGKLYTISTKGYRGSNSEHSYDEEKRSYDPTAIGKLAIQSSPDKNVGVNKSLVVEPTIDNARGYRAPNTDIEDLKDVNVMSPSEMLTPGTARNDDSIRVSIK